MSYKFCWFLICFHLMGHDDQPTSGLLGDNDDSYPLSKALFPKGVALGKCRPYIPIVGDSHQPNMMGLYPLMRDFLLRLGDHSPYSHF